MWGVTASDSALLRRLDDAVADLSPGYFALVMATGIVSIGMRAAGMATAAGILLIASICAYAVLIVLYAVRALRHGHRMGADARDPETGFAYFTAVAATGVLAVGLLETKAPTAAAILLGAAAAIWFVLGYVLPWQVLMSRDGLPILARTNGTWFIWSVASQSVAVGMASLQPASPGAAGLVGILAVLTWSVGTVLYVGVAVLAVLRVVHYGLTPQQFEPTYWVAMGAMAISVVAGASIVEMGRVPMVEAASGLIGGTVVIFWCFAAWLVPLLVGGGLWRHAVHRIPLRYTPALWSMVFPLGMFAVASMKLGRVGRLPAIEAFGVAFLWVAIAAWAMVSAGLVVTLVRGATGRIRQRRRGHP